MAGYTAGSAIPNAQSAVQRAQALIGRKQQAEQMLRVERQRLADLEASRKLHEKAQVALRALADARRQVVTRCIGGAMTAAVRQLWGADYSAALGSEGEGTKAAVAVMVTKGGHTGEVRASYGASVRNICSFALWLEVLWLARQLDPTLAPIVLWDEPFGNVHPRLLPAAGALLRGCADLGIQVICATNFEELLSDGATIIRIGKGGDDG